jgi:hypothetical protein
MHLEYMICPPAHANKWYRLVVKFGTVSDLTRSAIPFQSSLSLRLRKARNGVPGSEQRLSMSLIGPPPAGVPKPHAPLRAQAGRETLARLSVLGKAVKNLFAGRSVEVTFTHTLDELVCKNSLDTHASHAEPPRNT